MLEASVGAVPRETLPPASADRPGGKHEGFPSRIVGESPAQRDITRFRLRRAAHPEPRQVFGARHRPRSDQPPSPAGPGAVRDAPAAEDGRPTGRSGPAIDFAADESGPGGAGSADPSRAADERAAARALARAEVQRRLASPELRQMFSVVQRPAVADDSPPPDKLDAVSRATAGRVAPAAERRRAVIGAESGRPEALLPISRVFFQDGRGAGVSRLPPRKGAGRTDQVPATPQESAKIVLLPDRQPRPERTRESPPPRRGFSFALVPASAILVVLLYPGVVGTGDPVEFTEPDRTAAPAEALSVRPAAETERDAATASVVPTTEADAAVSEAGLSDLSPASGTAERVATTAGPPASPEPGDVERAARVDPSASPEPDDVEGAAMVESSASPETGDVEGGATVDPLISPEPDDGEGAAMVDPPASPEIGDVEATATIDPPTAPEPDKTAMADPPALPAPLDNEGTATVSQPLFSPGPEPAEGTANIAAPTVPLDRAGEEASGREVRAGSETLPQPMYDPPAATPETQTEAGPSNDPPIASTASDPGDGNQAPGASTSLDESAQSVIVPELDRKRWREVQQRLALAGFNPGSADGMPGPRTQQAIGAWQQEHGLTADGVLYADQLALLENETESAYRSLVKSARARAAAASEAERSSASAVQSTRTGRYIDEDGCLREPDGRAVPFYMPGCA